MGNEDRPESAVRAQIARVAADYRIDPDDISGAGIIVTSTGDAPTYELYVTVNARLPLTFGQYNAIVQPAFLQALNPSHVHAWTPGMLAEYRRQYDERMKLPNPPLIVHPDEVERWWNAIRE